MASKTTTLTVRMDPDIKQKAEMILDKLGIPVNVLFNTLYRQIILSGGIPFSLTIPDEVAMTDEELDEMMDRGWSQA